MIGGYMKRILIGLFCVSGLSFAEYESLNSIASMDRLEQLSRTLGQGSYSHPDNIDIIASPSLQTSLSAQDDNIWYIFKCKKDRFNGTKYCAMSKDNLMVSIYQGIPSVFVGTGHFPRRQSAIKIDNNKTIYGNEGSFQNDQAIINQMIKGETAYIRYVEWPYDFNKDEEIPLDGFVDAYNELKRKYKEL